MGLGPQRKDSKTFGTLTHPRGGLTFCSVGFAEFEVLEQSLKDWKVQNLIWISIFLSSEIPSKFVICLGSGVKYTSSSQY